ncbi:helix-turn-helix domain-containing protein [Trinickia sp.]|uniref:helix-turn-helix domain-containing protein n=1 Tax=Trinickia sp. TaxID=2571163 RepID=UPI003F820A3D
MDAHPGDLAGPPTEAPHVVVGGGIALQLLPRAPYSARDPAHAPSIGVALERQTGVHSIASDRREAYDRWPGTLAVTPAGMDVFSESARGGEYLVLRLMGTDLEVMPGQAVGQTRVCIAGAREAFALARALRRLLVAPVRDDARLADLAWRLVSRALAPASGQTAYEGRDRQRYGGVLDRIADEFGQPLAVDELAAMTGQSTLAFLRGFTAAIGMTPHAYLTEHRLQAARSLLAASRLPLADIALACGFSHQSHFGAAFKRAFALTPAHYRRLHRGPSGAACQRA